MSEAIGGVIAPGETLDSIGGVRILQRSKGYRFNLDAVLLARFGISGLEPSRPLKVIELGAGSGVVACLVAAWRPKWSVAAVEVQPGLAQLARRNAALNGLPVEVIESDWRKLGQRGRAGDAHLVLCNPPYHAAGRIAADGERAAARQELHGGLSEAVGAAARLVRGNGSVRFVCAAGRLADMMGSLAEASLGVVRLRFVQGRAADPAYAFLVEARPGSRRPPVIPPPLIVQDDGGYTPEAAAMLAPGA